MIKDLYNDKHEEVRKLILYLKELFDTRPDLSVDSPIIRDILEQLSKGVINFDLDKANDDLLEKIKEQERLMEEGKTHVEKIGVNVEEIKRVSILNNPDNKVSNPLEVKNKLEQEYPNLIKEVFEKIKNKEIIDDNLLNRVIPIYEKDINDNNLKQYGFKTEEEVITFIKNDNIFKNYKLLLGLISQISKNQSINLLQILITEQNKNHLIQNLNLITDTADKISQQQNTILELYDPYMSTLNYYIKDYAIENKNTFLPSKFNLVRTPEDFINNFSVEFNKVFPQVKSDIINGKVTENLIIKVFPIHLNRLNRELLLQEVY